MKRCKTPENGSQDVSEAYRGYEQAFNTAHDPCHSYDMLLAWADDQKRGTPRF